METTASSSAEAVVVLRWPEESADLERLRSQGVPRLLLIAPGAEAPSSGDCEEDWIRLPAEDPDVRARLESLACRAARHHAMRPAIDEHGLLEFGDGSILLSPLKAAIAAVLVEHYGQVVARDALMSAWPEERVTGNALRIQILRLRRRIAPLGLEVMTVPRCGYRLERAR